MTDGSEAARRGERDSLMVLARIRREGASEYLPVRVRNVSSGGLMAQAPKDFHEGLRVEVELDGVGQVAGAVAWAEAGRIGVAFDHPVDKQRARKAKTPAPPADSAYRLKGDFRRPPLKPR